MAEQDTGQERTEDPTPKRKEDARKNGQVLRAREFNTLVMMFGASIAVYVFGDMLAQSCTALMRDLLEIERAVIFDRQYALIEISQAAREFLIAQIPLFAVMGIAVFAGPSVIGGIRVSAEALEPKPERVDPIKGLQRMFSLHSLLELVKSLVKVAWLSLVAWLVGDALYAQVIALGRVDAVSGIEASSGVLMLSMLVLSAALIPIAMLDVPHQVWEHLKKLRMTRQEVRDELKETEGSPELRAQIRAQQRDMAQRRMMDDVPNADVVITNPTHFAVALRYDPAGDGAPQVVAKGRGHVAARIRELASEHGVVLFSAPPLARALYFSTDIGQHIPKGLYLAVARVLAYVYQLKRSAGTYEQPARPSELPVPDEFLRGRDAR